MGGCSLSNVAKRAALRRGLLLIAVLEEEVDMLRDGYELVAVQALDYVKRPRMLINVNAESFQNFPPGDFCILTFGIPGTDPPSAVHGVLDQGMNC